MFVIVICVVWLFFLYDKATSTSLGYLAVYLAQCLDVDRYLEPVVPVVGTSLARFQERYSDRWRRE